MRAQALLEGLVTEGLAVHLDDLAPTLADKEVMSCAAVIAAAFLNPGRFALFGSMI